MKSQARIVAVVALAALATIVVQGKYLGFERSGLSWTVVLEGFLTGAVVCAAWVVGASRKASATGLLVCVIILVASAASIAPLEAFVRTPMAWALATALAARFIVPARGAARSR
ncbi:hypothetical protein [Actinotalea sp. C106]|uniref:hypothetical protein n=1 Tax=Actinotalea sp. C106 TaxID=2908644 RepID=UPI002028EACC|nr:hypothetical protein [Actinotalea sp. C106]